MTKQRSKSRKVPSEAQLQIRTQRLDEFRDIEPIVKTDPLSGLEPGNSKIGYGNSLFKKVFVWNIPAVATCPGKSHWCSQNCYNGEDRPKTYKTETWQKNWWAVLNDSEKLKSKIIQDLSSTEGRSAVRIHSSGDFFSVPYIRFWINIAEQCESTAFWAYTRSWVLGDLLPALEELRRLPNVQLFASWDATMLPPPKDWRASFVGETPIERDSKIFDCPEQYDQSKNVTCVDCRYCINEKPGDVFFVLH